MGDSRGHSQRDKAYRRDIIIKYRKEQECIMIDMSIPCERNLPIKEAGTQNNENVENEYIDSPSCNGSTSAHQESLEENVNQVPGQIQVEELQKIALLGSAHVLRRTLSFK